MSTLPSTSPIVTEWFKLIEDLRQIEDRLHAIGYSDQTMFILTARDLLERFPPPGYSDADFVAPPPNPFAELISHAVASIRVSDLPEAFVAELLACKSRSATH